MFVLYTVLVPERLDQLSLRLYGYAYGYTEAILDANPGLSMEGIALESGRVLRVPMQSDTVETTEVVRLWT